MFKHDKYTPTDFKILDFRIQDNIPIRDEPGVGTVLEWKVKLNSEGNTEEEIFEGNWSPPQAKSLLAHWKKIKNSKKVSKNHDSFYIDHWIFYQKLLKAARKSVVASLMLVSELEKIMSEELKFASENEALQHLANLTGKNIKVAVDRPPTALTALGQPIVDAIWEEMQADEPGEHTKNDKPPIGFHAADQPLIESLWKESRDKHGL